MQSAPPCPSPLASGECEYLGCCSAGSCCWACNLWVLINYLFFLPVILPSEIPRLATDLPERVYSWCLETYFFFKTSFPGRTSVPASFVSLFIFYLLSYLFSKTMGCISGCLMSSASIQKLFCGIYSAFKCSFDEIVGETVVSLSSAILAHIPTCCFYVTYHFSSSFPPLLLSFELSEYFLMYHFNFFNDVYIFGLFP